MKQVLIRALASDRRYIFIGKVTRDGVVLACLMPPELVNQVV
jgi:hypothetical protein